MAVLFAPGMFSPIAIAKALSIHQRTLVNSRDMSWNFMKETVVKLLNSEVLL